MIYRREGKKKNMHYGLWFDFLNFDSNLHHCIKEENDDANCVDWH
jgi:hypothetical protein